MAGAGIGLAVCRLYGGGGVQRSGRPRRALDGVARGGVRGGELRLSAGVVARRGWHGAVQIVSASVGSAVVHHRADVVDVRGAARRADVVGHLARRRCVVGEAHRGLSSRSRWSMPPCRAGARRSRSGRAEPTTSPVSRRRMLQNPRRTPGLGTAAAGHAGSAGGARVPTEAALVDGSRGGLSPPMLDFQRVAQHGLPAGGRVIGLGEGGRGISRTRAAPSSASSLTMRAGWRPSKLRLSSMVGLRPAPGAHAVQRAAAAFWLSSRMRPGAPTTTCGVTPARRAAASGPSGTPHSTESLRLGMPIGEVA